MTSNLIYAIGTLLSWVGWLFVVRAVVLGTRIVTKAPGVDSDGSQRGILWSTLGGAVCLAVAGLMPMAADKSVAALFHAGQDVRLPLVWFVMPWMAWMAVGCLTFVVTRGLQGGLSILPAERLERAKAAGLWLVAMAAFVFLYVRDPGNKIEVLKGGILLSTSAAISLVLFGVAAIFAMTLAARATATRGLAKAVVTQATLLAGAIVFGLPFAFLVITSFKEDRDMSSPNGIVWVPRVQNTVPYFDHTDPLYEGKYEGQAAQGSIIERHADGTVKIDIQKPMAIRGATFTAQLSSLHEVPKDAPVFEGTYKGQKFVGLLIHQMDDGRKDIQFSEPAGLSGQHAIFTEDAVTPVRHIGFRVANYTEALDFLPPETNHGLVYLKNTLLIVIFSVIGTILSSAVVAYAFSRMQFPGRNQLFAVVLATMMLPGAVTLMPQFLIFRWFGWIDTLLPLWVPSFFGSAFNIFLLRQFFMQIPMELEDAAKIDGCSYPRTFWSIMMPLIKPALAVIAIWTFMGAWNNFMGPLIYINSPENMPLSYALKLFQGDRVGDPGLLMAFATLTMLPVLALFFFAQRYFIEGVTLSGLGGR